MRRLIRMALLFAAAHAAAGYLFRNERRRYAGNRRHILVVQGGAQLRPAGDEISDAVVSVMMGGVTLDLRGSRVTRPPIHLDILCVMGGLELIVPEEWKVVVNVEPTMGGVRDARRGTVDSERAADLVLSGRVIMGGIDISSTLPGGAHRQLIAQPARSETHARGGPPLVEDAGT
jgi:hypothetical protein